MQFSESAQPEVYEPKKDEKMEEIKPVVAATPVKEAVKSILDVIGQLEGKVQKSHGKKLFKEVYNKETTCLPCYQKLPGWSSEYDEVFCAPDRQCTRRKCDKCNLILTKRERSRTRKHSCGRSLSASKKA